MNDVSGSGQGKGDGLTRRGRSTSELLGPAFLSSSVFGGSDEVSHSEVKQRTDEP